MVKIPINWNLFKDTVVGRAGPHSCIFENGEIYFSTKPIRKKSSPNLKLLADLIRSGETLPKEVTDWLADLLDPKPDTEFQMTLGKRKGARGAKRQNVALHWNVADYVLELEDKGEPHKAAIGKATEKFGMSKNTIENAVKSLSAAMDADDCISEKPKRKASKHKAS